MDYVVVYHPEYTLYLCIAIAICAVAAIVATVRGWKRGVYVLKPLTTLLILALAWHLPSMQLFYKILIEAGLVFSLFGDVFLMLPRDRFVAGLVSFLVAHLLYVGAFTDGWRAWPLTGWLIVPFVAYAVVLLRILLPHVPSALKPAVIVYAAALLVMAWQAAAAPRV